MLGRGLRVGLGTDSVASVSPLDLLAEAREARAIGGLDAEAALRLLTLDGARALGLDARWGAWLRGSGGTSSSVDLPGAVDGLRLADTLLSLSSSAVRRTVLGGREVYRKPDHAAARVPVLRDSRPNQEPNS